MRAAPIIYALPALMNELFGTKFKIVLGYNARRPQINLAMERGEVEGRVNSWASWKANRPRMGEATRS